MQNKHLNKRLERCATENKADSPHRKMVECNDSLPLIILFLTADLYLVYRCYFSLQILIFLHQILVFLPQIKQIDIDLDRFLLFMIGFAMADDADNEISHR